MAKKTAIIAGQGQLPVQVARNLFEQGNPAVIYAIREDLEPFENCSSDIVPVRKLNLGFVIESMRKHGVEQLIMVGRVPKSLIFKPALFDRMSQKFIASLLLSDDHSLLGAVVDLFEGQGFKVIGYRDIVPELLAGSGHLFGRKPAADELKDADYAFEICKKLVPLSFGQSVTVHKGAVIAVEAIEGTDKMILRAGELSNGGVVAKMMRLDQDERYDIPTVGPRTLKNMAEAGLTCLAVHAGRTLILDAEEFASVADKENISVIGVEVCAQSS